MSVWNTLRFIATHPLNAETPLLGLARFARWQIASRLLDGDFIVPWVNDSRFKVRRGQTGLTGNIYTGLHEYRDMAFLLHYLRPDDLFLDVGANVGSYTVLACAAVGARCVALEPVPTTFAHLVDNVRINGKDTSVTCLNIAAGSQEGTIRFTSDRDTLNHVVAETEAAGTTIDVQVVPIDAALRGVRPRLVKIDVEGYETRAIEGAQETLSGDEPSAVIVELNGAGGPRYGFDEEKIVQRMLSWGFRPHSYDPGTRSLQELLGKNASGGNTLFVRGVEFARQRLATAARYRVHGREV